MKKCISRILSFGVVCLSLGQLAKAQSPAPPPPAPPVARSENAERSEAVVKSDQTEIVIRQKGNKDSKVTLEIKNGNYFINGKPLEKFDDQNVIVEKREVNNDIVVMPDMSYNISPFRINPDEEERIERKLSEEDKENMDMAQLNADKIIRDKDMQRLIRKNIQIRNNAAFLGVSSKRSEKGGATVLEITKGSPAEKAGLRKGDVITKLNDSAIESPENLFDAVHNYKPGDKVKISFNREGKAQTVTAILEKSDYRQKEYNYNYNFRMPPMPPMGDMRGMDEFRRDNRQPKIGIKAQDAEDGKGVNVLEVEDSSAAWKAGLKKGDIILQFDGNDVNSANELVEQLQAARQKILVKMKILREGTPREIEVKIPRKLKTAEL